MRMHKRGRSSRGERGRVELWCTEGGVQRRELWLRVVDRQGCTRRARCTGRQDDHRQGGGRCARGGQHSPLRCARTRRRACWRLLAPHLIRVVFFSAEIYISNRASPVPASWQPLPKHMPAHALSTFLLLCRASSAAASGRSHGIAASGGVGGAHSSRRRHRRSMYIPATGNTASPSSSLRCSYNSGGCLRTSGAAAAKMPRKDQPQRRMSAWVVPACTRIQS